MQDIFFLSEWLAAWKEKLFVPCSRYRERIHKQGLSNKRVILQNSRKRKRYGVYYTHKLVMYKQILNLGDPSAINDIPKTIKYHSFLNRVQEHKQSEIVKRTIL